MSLAEGDTAAAVAHVRRALSREAEPARLDSDNIQLHLLLAETCNENREFDTARTAAERALQLAAPEPGQLPYSLSLAQSHLELGVALAGQGDLAAGRTELDQALKQLQDSVGPDAPTTRRAASKLEGLAASVSQR
jgi:tetratricopeptide (TPR) repeat protein